MAMEKAKTGQAELCARKPTLTTSYEQKRCSAQISILPTGINALKLQICTRVHDLSVCDYTFKEGRGSERYNV